MKMTDATRTSIIKTILELCERIDATMGGDDWGDQPHKGSLRERLWDIRNLVNTLADTKLVEVMMFLIDLDAKTTEANKTIYTMTTGDVE